VCRWTPSIPDWSKRCAHWEPGPRSPVQRHAAIGDAWHSCGDNCGLRIRRTDPRHDSVVRRRWTTVSGGMSHRDRRHDTCRYAGKCLRTSGASHALRLPILFVTHALDEVVRLADTLVLVRTGHVLLDSASGSAMRVRIPAREVILAAAAPQGISVHNVIAGTVHGFRRTRGAMPRWERSRWTASACAPASFPIRSRSSV
jgi:hypothetical protein